MSDKTTGERPQGAPSQRALEAMESAVRRARERAGVVTGAGPIEADTQPVSITPFLHDPPAPLRPSAPSSAEPAEAPGSPGELARREHWLTISVVVVAVLVVMAGITLAVSPGGGGQQSAAPPVTRPTTAIHASTASPTQRATTNGHSGVAAAPSTTTTTATTSTTAPPATPGGPPVIAALSPASGAAGTGIQVAGSNFLSSSGQIVASFNGQVTETSCPAQNTCTVTVPPISGASSAQVTITTATGTSNAVTFNYS